MSYNILQMNYNEHKKLYSKSQRIAILEYYSLNIIINVKKLQKMTFFL